MKEILLESWDRNVKIMGNLASRITEENRHAKPSPDGWALDHQLAHMHSTRQWFLAQFAAEQEARTTNVMVEKDGDWVPIDDLEEIKRQCELSGVVIRDTLRELFESGAERIPPYDHPVYFLQHMIWHEGWHAGLIMLALRLNGEEPTEEWEDRNLWGIWRDPEC